MSCEINVAAFAQQNFAGHICNAQFGFHMPWAASYIIAAVVVIACFVVIVRFGKKELLANPCK